MNNLVDQQFPVDVRLVVIHLPSWTATMCYFVSNLIFSGLLSVFT